MLMPEKPHRTSFPRETHPIKTALRLMPPFFDDVHEAP